MGSAAAATKTDAARASQLRAWNLEPTQSLEPGTNTKPGTSSEPGTWNQLRAWNLEPAQSLEPGTNSESGTWNQLRAWNLEPTPSLEPGTLHKNQSRKCASICTVAERAVIGRPHGTLPHRITHFVSNLSHARQTTDKIYIPQIYS